MRIHKVLLYSFLSLVATAAQTADPGRYPDMGEIPVIATTLIKDMAMAGFDQFGRPVIFFNPNVSAGADDQFLQWVQAHEYGHHRLHHLTLASFATNPYQRVQLQRVNEVAADQYATRYWMERNPDVVVTAINTLKSVSAVNWGDLTHYPAAVRVKLVEAEVQNYTRTHSSESSASAPGKTIDSPSPAQTSIKLDNPVMYFLSKCETDPGLSRLKARRSSKDGWVVWQSRIRYPESTYTEIYVAEDEPNKSKVTLSAAFIEGELSDAEVRYQDLLTSIQNELGPNWKVEEQRAETQDGREKWEANIRKAGSRVDIRLALIEARRGKPKVLLEFSPVPSN